MEQEDRIRELIAAFDAVDDRYKREEMEEALALQQEITPHLIRILEDLAADPEGYVLDDHFANVYAVALLSHFQEPSAHLPIIRAFLIPHEELDDIWGDMVTMTLPALLFQTCNGSLDEIKKLVLNKDADEFVRGSAVEAMTYAVARGVAERREIVDFLAGLFTGDEAEKGDYFWSNVAAYVAEIHPEGVMEIIGDATERGLIFEGYVGLDEIEKENKKSADEVLENLRQKTDPRIPSDVHEYISWFSCFNEERTAGSLKCRLEDAGTRHDEKARKKKKAANRSKKKMAKKSRKKNRR